MSDYFRRLSKEPQLPPVKYHWESKYHSLLSREPAEVLGVALATPDIETSISRALAARFNYNGDKYDKVIDHVYNEIKVGGSSLHHNLDGSHTFEGALRALRQTFPEEHDFTLRLEALEHLARDFTTPSGINPFLSPTSFVQAKLFLQETGLSPSLANDLLNLNAAEMAGAIFGPGLLLLQGSLNNDESTWSAARQVGRLATTYFFAGNAIGLLCACALFIRSVTADHREDTVTSYAIGIGEVVLAATLFPFVPLSVTLIIATAASAWWHRLFRADLGSELDALFRVQFPQYRSYLSQI